MPLAPEPMPTRLLRALAIALLALAAGCASHPTAEEREQADLMATGENLERAGDYDDALVQYVKALGLDAGNAEAHYRVGRVHAAIGNVVLAREGYLRALAQVPDHAGAQEGLGLLYLEEGERNVAAALLHKAVAKDPGRWRAYNGLGVLADLENNHRLAQAYLGAALELRPSDTMVLNNLGYSYYLDGKIDQAQRQFQLVLAADPHSEKGWSILALMQTRQGQYAQAVQSFERIMSPSEARYSAGYICFLDGRLTAAEKLFRDSIRVSTSYYAPAHAALKRLHEEEVRRSQLDAPLQ